MRALSIQLTTLSPMAIRADHAESGAEMIGYIPGSSFMGALAAIHRTLDSRGQEFTRFFLNEEVLFSDLYPASFETLSGAINSPVYPLPRTAISCKRYPGFLPNPNPNKKKAEESHGVEDSLRDWAMFALSEYKKKPPSLEALKKHKHCADPECGESMDRLSSGYYRRPVELAPEQKSDKPSSKREQAKSEHKRLQTRTGINRQTGTVEEGILYNRMVVEEDVHFWGQIRLPDNAELYDAFYEFLETTTNVGTANESMLRLGTGRTRGLGKVAMYVEEMVRKEDSEEQRFQQFQKRILKLDKHIGEQAKALADPQEHFFAVTLHSPLILYDELLRYQGVLDAATLNSILGKNEISGLHLLYKNAGLKRVSGWNELWGTPKTNEYAIEAGSVFLFVHTGKLNEDQQRALFDLEEQGLGKRRAEGFGRICLSDDFHSEGRQQ